MGKTNPQERHVGLLVETDDSWGRNVVAAVCAVARNSGWTLLFGPRDDQGRLRLPKNWNGDGVIASLRTPSLVRHVMKQELPVVDVSLMVPKADWFARVATDDAARAHMAFQHLHSHGLTNFACYAPPIRRYSDGRAEAFEKVVTDAGFKCHTYQANSRDDMGWLANHGNALRWLKRLPRPLAIFAADPYPARQLIEICAASGMRCPDDIAILSGDDDELLCNAALPQISAVELASHRIGETAAHLLARMMNGAAIPQKTTLIPPLGVKARHSTDLLAMADEEINEILRFMRDRALDGITVGDVLREFPISRRRLEQRFRSELNRSPAEEIRRVRMEYICRLLLDTERSIGSIALSAGFATGASLAQAFKQQMGKTPSDFRKAKRVVS
jgi:LacI family transcriptional regulator